ncbi:hypothetical protein TWF481_006425 [Arthrobotrys musiformis]|uniref:Uncharacterized protein n=1 Tax=Arthrobotrys musiformis TaxID=47236 RepID=A0AAV9WHM5_9PEZI
MARIYLATASAYGLFFFFAPYIILLLQATTVLAQNKTKNTSGAPINSKENLRWKRNCNSEQAEAINGAFETIKVMLEDVLEPDWASFAAIDFLGTHLIASWGDYKRKVQNMMKAAHDWTKRSYWFSGPWITCEKPFEGRCDHYARSDLVWMTYSGEDTSPVSQLDIAICSSWFERPPLKLLIEQAKYCRKKQPPSMPARSPWDIRFYESRELWMLHAIFHVREVYYQLPTTRVWLGSPKLARYLIAPPPFHDYVEIDPRYTTAKVPVIGAWEARKLALNGVGKTWEKSGPLGSPTNFAFYILASYVTKQMGEYPVYPSRYSLRSFSWYTGENLVRMCTKEPFKLGMTKISSYTPQEMGLAIAPWVFTPQNPPAVE